MTTMRSLPPLTVLRLRTTLGCLVVLELVLAFAALAASSSQVYKMVNDLHLPRAPPKLGYTVAMSVFTVLAASALLVLHIGKPNWWMPFSRKGLAILTGLTALFAIFWIGVAGSAFFTCSDMCSTWGPGVSAFIEYTSSLCCSCTLGVSQQVNCNAGRHSFTQPVGYDGDVGAAYWSTQAFAILNMLLFFASTAIWTLLLIQTPSSLAGLQMLPQENHGLQAPGYAYPVTPGGDDNAAGVGAAYEPYKSYPFDDRAAEATFPEPDYERLAVPRSYY